MRILLVGASGTLGSALATALEDADHDVLEASQNRSALSVDLADPASIRRLYGRVGPVDAVISAAGRYSFRPLDALTEADFRRDISSKLMGQVNLVRLGLDQMRAGGSFTLTGGVASRNPMAGGALISLVNAGLEGFVRSAAQDLPQGVRLNAIAPGWIRETLVALGQDPSPGLPAAEVARAYVTVLGGTMTGQVIDAVLRPAGEPGP
jgi:NAD(P)-dependent dehydrogenase (short-subunit alcohol dehydrogenase family)